jgi:hypothetical protein
MATGIDGRDLAKVVTGTLSAPGTVALGVWRNVWNLTLGGATSVTARLQRSFDNGGSWHNLNAQGIPVILGLGSEVIQEQELGVVYRLDVTAVSGTLTVRASQ